ncbi:class I SAM-dependent methyltransferase [Kibdelosporangium persicum]|uniref:class I SAM-dependent methyltransferase n=1 Tax=Kibdelosporangium persicum TaxID=2698649 RepID=UPI0015650A42
MTVDLVVGNAAAPVACGQFDMVMVRHLIWALPQPRSALRRWVGLLKPAGQLVPARVSCGSSSGQYGQPGTLRRMLYRPKFPVLPPVDAVPDVM